MTQTANLFLLNEEKEKYLDIESSIKNFDLSEEKKVYIDECKLLNYKSELLFESTKQKPHKSESISNLKVITITILLSSIIQSILFVFIIPNGLSLAEKMGAYFLVFGWIMLFNSIFFIPGVLKIVSNYLNEAFTAYEYL